MNKFQPLKLIPSGRGQISVLQWSDIGYVSYSFGQAPSLGVVGQVREHEVGWVGRWYKSWEEFGEGNKYDQSILYEILKE